MIITFYYAFFLILGVVIGDYDSRVIRDGHLTSLIDILQSPSINAILQDKSWSNSKTSVDSASYQSFLNALTPWIIGEPSVDVKDVEIIRPPHIELNCSNSLYSNVFSGDLLKEDAFIIDFVPFGYDIDKLEIRLIESYHVIDLFIIYESPLNQSSRLHFREQ